MVVAGSAVLVVGRSGEDVVEASLSVGRAAVVAAGVVVTTFTGLQEQLGEEGEIWLVEADNNTADSHNRPPHSFLIAWLWRNFGGGLSDRAWP